MNQTTKIIIGAIVVILVTWGIYSLVAEPGAGIGTPSGQPVATTGPIKIGVISPVTGEIAGPGENVVAAIELARDEINQAGGINGRQIETIVEDGKCDPKAGASAASKLTSVDKVAVIVGGGCSSETLAAAPIVEQAHVPTISSISTNAKISKAGDYIFRFIPSDSFQAKFAAEYVYNTLGDKKVALLTCLSDWCVGIHDTFRDRFTELGGTLVADEQFNQDDKDLRTPLTKIKSANPELIYFVSYPDASIAGIKQARELGLKTQMLGADAWSDPKVAAETGAAGEGTLYTVPATKNYPESFVKAMADRTGGKELHSYAARAYDIMMALAGIMKRVGSDSEKIKNAPYQIKDYQGIADTYTMDQNGDMSSAN